MKIVKNNGLFDIVENNQVVKVYKCEADAVRFVEKITNTHINTPIVNSVNITLPQKFGINQRFGFLSQLVSMVLNDVSPSLLITGQGGLGKSYSVMAMLEDKEEGEDYIIVKGYSTAKGLYRTLYENNGKIIIFDDTDSVLKDATSLNILKGALDSYSKRVISWNAEFSLNETLPNSFEFVGKVIFISNLGQESINQAVKSRSLIIDLEMSTEDKIERMETILVGVLPELSMEIKQDAFNFLKENANICKDLNMRTLIKIAKIRASFPDSWSELALYTIGA
jgi:hypothetical protein